MSFLKTKERLMEKGEKKDNLRKNCDVVLCEGRVNILAEVREFLALPVS